MEPGAYLVLCKEPSVFKKFYGFEASGVFDKSLKNSGEKVTLKDAARRTVESVTYKDRAPWPLSADGYSASLERICPTAAPNQVANWAPSFLSRDYQTRPSGTPGEVNSQNAPTRPPIIETVTFSPPVCQPEQSITVNATVDETVPATVELLYRVAQPGSESEETTVAMTRVEKGRYTADLPGQDANRIVRFRVRATGKDGTARLYPHPNEIRPALSVYVSPKPDVGRIPVAHFFNVGAAEHRRASEYRRNHARSRGRGGFGFGGRRELMAEDRSRMEAGNRLAKGRFERAWTELTLREELPGKSLLPLAAAFRKEIEGLSTLQEELELTGDPVAFSGELTPRLAALDAQLIAETEPLLNEGQEAALEKSLTDDEAGGRGFSRRFRGDPSQFVNQLFNVESRWLGCALLDGLDANQLENLRIVHREAAEKRQVLSTRLRQERNFDFRVIMENVGALNDEWQQAAGKIISADQVSEIDEGTGDPLRSFGRGMRGSPSVSKPLPPQGRSAFIYVDPDSKQPQLFDFINIVERKSGYKVRFHKDRPLDGMTTINLLYESDESTILNESLSFDLYRLAGNATPGTGYARVLIDGMLAGYHLWFEQPNGAFFRGNRIDDGGNLYKLIWMGNHVPSKHTPRDKRPQRMDIVGRHEKKTNPHDGYDDIIALIETLENATAEDDVMWAAIQKHFDVDQVINYFAANSLVSHWDGFFNNYFIYHDTEGSGKWTLYPWDQDSTWSQRGGVARELYELPLDFGAEGARPPGANARAAQEPSRRNRGGGRGFRGFGGGRGGPRWWRDGGDISRPLLANPEFRRRYLARLEQLVDTVFTEDVFQPRLDTLRYRLEPEIRLRAAAARRNEDAAVEDFVAILESLLRHLVERRAFVLAELAKIKAPKDR